MEDPHVLSRVLEYHYETIPEPARDQIGCLCCVSKAWSNIVTTLWGDQESVWHAAITTAVYHGDLCCLKYHMQRMPKHFIKNYDQYLIYALISPSNPCLEYLWESYLAYPKKDITETTRTALRESNTLCEFLISKKIKFDPDVVAPEMLDYCYSPRTHRKKMFIRDWMLDMLKRGDLGNLLDIYESAIRNRNIRLVKCMDRYGLAADWTWERNPDIIRAVWDAKRTGKNMDIIPQSHPPSDLILDGLWVDVSTRVIAKWLMTFTPVQPRAKKIKIDL